MSSLNDTKSKNYTDLEMIKVEVGRQKICLKNFNGPQLM